MKQIQPIVLPNNLGTLETLRVTMTIDTFDENTNINVRYMLGSLIDTKVQNVGVLKMDFATYKTLSTTIDALEEWTCQQLGIALLSLESISVPKPI